MFDDTHNPHGKKFYKKKKEKISPYIAAHTHLLHTYPYSSHG